MIASEMLSTRDFSDPQYSIVNHSIANSTNKEYAWGVMIMNVQDYNIDVPMN